MTEFDNTNRRVLFRVDDNQKQSDKSPDYRGNIDVGGIAHQISGWIKTSAKGVKYMSLAIRPKTEAPDKSKPRTEDFRDSVPFLIDHTAGRARSRSVVSLKGRR
jgi:hypothetical protein